MGNQGSTEALRRSLRDNSANRAFYLAALEAAENQLSFDALADVVAQAPAPATCTVPPRQAVSNLVNSGALVQTITVDGEPYPGTRDELEQDENLSDDAQVTYWVQRSAAGEALLVEMEPARRTDELFAEKPGFVPYFVKVLQWCCGEGLPRAVIDERLRADPIAVRRDERTRIETVSPSFYTSNLEDRGALVWAGGFWKTTEAGKRVLARWQQEEDNEREEREEEWSN